MSNQINITLDPLEQRKIIREIKALCAFKQFDNKKYIFALLEAAEDICAEEDLDFSEVIILIMGEVDPRVH